MAIFDKCTKESLVLIASMLQSLNLSARHETTSSSLIVLCPIYIVFLFCGHIILLPFTLLYGVAGTPVKSEGFYWSTVSLHCGKLCMILNLLTYETNIWNEENFQPVFTVFKYQVVFCS